MNGRYNDGFRETMRVEEKDGSAEYEIAPRLERDERIVGRWREGKFERRYLGRSRVTRRKDFGRGEIFSISLRIGRIALE